MKAEFGTVTGKVFGKLIITSNIAKLKTVAYGSAKRWHWALPAPPPARREFAA